MSIQLEPVQDYNLSLSDDLSYRIFVGGKPSRFSAPASTRGVAKIYTLSRGGALLYVGVAKQPMSVRLNYGFKATGRGGYHGYKWKGIRDHLELAVWVGFDGRDRLSVRQMETIEAEVVLLCRNKSGQWPQYQHEIHFYESYDGHRQAAAQIYEHATRPAGCGDVSCSA